MLYDIYYIVPSTAIGSISRSCTRQVVVLQTNTADNLREVYKSLPEDNRFCLCLSDPGEPTASQLESILSFFFFPVYVQIEGSPLIFLSFADESKTFANSLRQYAATQGYENITVVNIEAAKTNFLPADPGQLSMAYRKLLGDPDFIPQRLLLLVNSLSCTESLDKVLEEEENLFKQEAPDLYTRKLKIKEEGQQLTRVQQLLKAAEAELANQTTYIEYIRAGSQAAELQQFYTNEYEVLPGWYKKLGHIIKVITGKRRFKSLFNDHVKKYNP